MNLEELYLEMIGRAEKITLPEDVSGSIYLKIATEEGDIADWLVSLVEQKILLTKESPVQDPTVSVAISEQNLLKIASKELSPTMAFMTGKLKLSGDRSLLTQLQSLLVSS